MGIILVSVLCESIHFSRRYSQIRFLHFHPGDLDLLSFDLKTALPVTLHVGNIVALRQTRLVLGWVTVCERVNHLGM